MAELIQDGKASRIATEQYVNDRLAGFSGGGTGSGLVMAEVEFDTENLTYAPEVFLLDQDGNPTDQTIVIDEWYDNTKQVLHEPIKTGWQRLNTLTPEESLALAAQHAADGFPITRILTFWEYRSLHPNEMSREEYGAGRLWRFEYDGTTWSPVEDVDHAEE